MINMQWENAELIGEIVMSEYFIMGYDAYYDWADLEDNPFDPIDQSYAHLQWEMGWTLAEDDNVPDEDEWAY